MNPTFKFNPMGHQYLVLHNLPRENSGTTGLMGGRLVWWGARHELDDVAQKNISEKCRQETKCFTQIRLNYSTNRWNPALYCGQYFLWKWSHILILACWLYSSILPPFPLLTLYQNISPGSRLSVWTYRNMTRFYGEELLASLANPRLKYHPLSAVRDSLFNIFPATHHIGSRSSICNLRTCHAVVTGTHLSWLKSNKHYIFRVCL